MAAGDIRTITTGDGDQVRVVVMRGGKEYAMVDERVRLAWSKPAPGTEELGFSVVGHRVYSLDLPDGPRHFYEVEIERGGKRVVGTAEIKFWATEGADASAPLECAETSAIGRALGFFNIANLNGIASAEEVVRAVDTGPRPGLQERPAGVTPMGTPALATAAQVKAIYIIARNSGLSEQELDERSRQTLGTVPAQLTKRQASEFIDKLKGSR